MNAGDDDGHVPVDLFYKKIKKKNFPYKLFGVLDHYLVLFVIQTYETTHLERFTILPWFFKCAQTSTSLPVKTHCWNSFEGHYISLTRPPPPPPPFKFFICTMCSLCPSPIFILRVLDVSTVALGKCQFHCRRAWKWILSGAKWALLDAFSIS